MFTVTDTYRFTRPIAVLVPKDGGHEKQTFSATFKVMPAEEQDAYDLMTSDGSTGFLRGIIDTLDELVDDAGAPMPYNNALRDKLLRFQFVRVALTTAYFDALKKAIEGN